MVHITSCSRRAELGITNIKKNVSVPHSELKAGPEMPTSTCMFCSCLGWAGWTQIEVQGDPLCVTSVLEARYCVCLAGVQTQGPGLV